MGILLWCIDDGSILGSESRGDGGGGVLGGSPETKISSISSPSKKYSCRAVPVLTILREVPGSRLLLR